MTLCCHLISLIVSQQLWYPSWGSNRNVVRDGEADGQKSKNKNYRIHSLKRIRKSSIFLFPSKVAGSCLSVFFAGTAAGCLSASRLSLKRTLLVLVVAIVGTDDGVADDRVVTLGPVAVVAADACFDFLMNLGEFLGGRPRRFFPMALAGLSCCK